MPRKCCVPGCKSNYLTSKENYVTTFSFPKDEARRAQWLRAIPRKDWTPSSGACVCRKHFSDDWITDFEQFSLPDGSINKVQLRCPKLKEDAVPHLFAEGNLPKYLSSVSNPPRRNPEERKKTIFKRQQDAIEAFMKKDMILNFSEVKVTYDKHISLFNWEIKICDKDIYFYTLDYEDCVHIKNSIHINSNLQVNLYVNNNRLSYSELSWILPCDFKLSRWSQLSNLLSHFKSDQNTTKDENNQTVAMSNINKGLDYLNTAVEVLHEVVDFQYHMNLEIIVDQLKQIVGNRNRYSRSTIIMSFLLYCQSPSCYNLLREYLVLPHKRYLQSLSSSLELSSESEGSNKNYLVNVSKTLSDTEKVVALQIDEIYISPRLDYRGNSITGMAANSSTSNTNDLAKTVLTFMVSSAFGKLSEVVSMFPVNNIKGSELTILINKCIHFVQSCGFEVLCVITDNHSINRSAFKIMSPSYSISNPKFPEKKIFLLFDFVHLFKNVWKNWLNLKNIDQTFTYCNFECSSSTENVMYAKFQHLKDFYEKEKNCVVKQAYKLNHKSLYPSVLDRQKVPLADNIFHSSTIAALSSLENYTDTAKFLQIIRTWWDIVNNRQVIKGYIKRNVLCQPLSRSSDQIISWLQNFALWLERWHGMKDYNGHLSNETYGAMHHSTVSFLSLIKYVFETYSSVEYILPGKFTTENLEKRFGLYRSLAGCNYNVSLEDIVNSEKKIRIKHIFKKAKKNTNFSLSELKRDFEILATSDRFEDIDDPNNFSFREEVQLFLCIFDNSSYLQNLDLDEGAKLYVCGYAVHVVAKRITCESCCALIKLSKGEFSENHYFNSLQRGGLSLPSDNVCFIFTHMYAILCDVSNKITLEKLFLQIRNQKDVLYRLTLISIKNDYYYSFFLDNCPECHTDRKVILKNICSVFCNIMLNNYVKNKNNSNKSLKTNETPRNTQKKRKLNTFA